MTMRGFWAGFAGFVRGFVSRNPAPFFDAQIGVNEDLRGLRGFIFKSTRGKR